MKVFISTLTLFLAICSKDVNAYCFKEAGKKYSIDWKLLKAIAMTESSLKQNAVNYNKDKQGKVLSVDRGLMQINSAVWFDYFEKQGISQEELIQDPCINVKAGGHILNRHFAIVGKRNWYAVGTYNAGFSKADVANKRRDYYINKVKKHLSLIVDTDEDVFNSNPS